MANEDPDRWAPNPKDVERRKKELLAGARGQGKEPPNAMMGAGMQFVVVTLVGLFLGKWLDGKLGTQPWLMIAGMLLGGGLGFWTLIRMAKGAGGSADRGKKDGK